MLPRVPTSPWYTAVLVVAWIVLLGYIFVSHSTLGYIIAALLFIFFVVPAVVIALLTRADARAEAQRHTHQNDTPEGADSDFPESDA